MVKILVTGAAGFIGAALCKILLSRGDNVTGIDNLDDYYDVELKNARIERLSKNKNFEFLRINISQNTEMVDLFSKNRFEVVVNLAAQAGVRYSIENPSAYINTNLVGFGNVLEGCRSTRVNHLVYASSSSVYGTSKKLPFSELDSVDNPISLYAATKRANELMAHVYSHIHRLPTTGLRFFTVYGPWGRPDMALFRFTKGIIEDKPIPVYNNGDMVRDFTYIDDIVEGIVRAIERPPKCTHLIRGTDDWDCTATPYRIYNIGNSRPVPLMKYIEALENALGKKAKLELLPMQPGDVQVTEADISRVVSELGYSPQIEVGIGVARFVEWYCDYYGVQLGG